MNQGVGGRKEMVEFEGKEGRTENRKVPNRTRRFHHFNMVCTILSALPFVHVRVDTPSSHTLYITPPQLQRNEIKRSISRGVAMKASERQTNDKDV